MSKKETKRTKTKKPARKPEVQVTERGWFKAFLEIVKVIVGTGVLTVLSWIATHPELIRDLLSVVMG